MPTSKNGFGQRSMPDARSGGGYGTYSGKGIGGDSQAERVWPYHTVTDADEPVDPATLKATKKQRKKTFVNDRPAAMNYKSGSYVDGKTRGLTGIMSGMDHYDILEAIIKRTRPRENIKPVGNGGPFSAMSSDMHTRTRPGYTIGSKEGWFSPPPPKDSDPSNELPALDLKDVALNKEKRALHNASLEKNRVHKKNKTFESKISILRSYVLLVESMQVGQSQQHHRKNKTSLKK